MNDPKITRVVSGGVGRGRCAGRGRGGLSETLTSIIRNNIPPRANQNNLILTPQTNQQESIYRLNRARSTSPNLSTLSNLILNSNLSTSPASPSSPQYINKNKFKARSISPLSRVINSHLDTPKSRESRLNSRDLFNCTDKPPVPVRNKRPYFQCQKRMQFYNKTEIKKLIDELNDKIKQIYS